MNVEQGVIIGWMRSGPSHKLEKSGVKKGDIPGLLPALHHWSDIAFLQYQQLAAEKGKARKDLAKLKLICFSQVDNPVTNGVIARAIKSSPKHQSTSFPSDANLNEDPPEFEPFPDGKYIPWDNKLEFGMDEPEGKALLATPNGRGAAWLLIQHKSVFGQRRTIEKVQVYWTKTEDGDFVNMIFYLNKA